LPVPLTLSGEERFQISGDDFVKRALFRIAGTVSCVDGHAGWNECNLPRKPAPHPCSNIGQTPFLEVLKKSDYGIVFVATLPNFLWNFNLRRIWYSG